MIFRERVRATEEIEGPRVHYQDPDVYDHLSIRFSEALRRVMAKKTGRVVILGIGSSRIIGDSIGPRVVSILQDQGGLPDHVILKGTMDDPIHFGNLQEQIQFLQPDDLVIAVDAGVGKHVGYIGIRRGSIEPGSGGGKVSVEVGDIACVATVLKKLKSIYGLLAVEPEFVEQMSNILAESLRRGFYLTQRKDFKEKEAVK